MSYNNKYSNKPFESASKTGHTSIINDKEVKNFLSNCHIPSYDKEVSQQDMQKYFLRDIQNNPIKNIIAIDGGFTDVYVRKEFPSSTIAFFQFGALFFKYQDLIEMEEKPFIDPDDFSKLQNMQRMKLILPTKGVTFKKEIDLIDSVRKSIYDFFVNTIENQGLIKALTWLIFEEYNFNNTIDWTIAQCPHCKEPIKFTKNDLTSEYTLSCPHCQETIYLTDVFRLHEVIDNELGAGGVLGYLCTTIEQLIIVYLIKEILNTKAALLKETLIVKDGPLAFFGQPANIH
ncbi:DNA double-strand break repair nuclease NurA, partial [Thomasclavelia cocleata]|uniref:DNA double-strand break repair nuclease NurA n=1 Tax=Thomasclavelia cocleata TaxID=69824 RepID=UPI0025A22860